MKDVLHLEYSRCVSSQVDAWFLSGGNLICWVNELARCGLADAETKLYLVPISLERREPAGVLAIPGKGRKITAVPMGQPCRMVAGKLVIPANAVIHPPLRDDEVRALMIWPVQFLHPLHGLVGFGEEAELTLADLLTSPGQGSGSWNYAQPPRAPLPEFRGIQMALPPVMDEVFGEAAQEIGNRSLEEIPPAPDEPGTGPVDKLGRKLKTWVARGLSKLLRNVPRTASRRTWVNDVEDWARRELGGVNQALDVLRNKELHRLLHLFDHDPDQALKHAIPLHSFGTRGKAPPSSKLGERAAEFNLQGMGGKPGDAWDVPQEIESQLRAHYRKRAATEMQLKRYRRAAYIYAQLLGDLVSAANALVTGGHFQEAAVLFEDHLNNPVQAAKCLANGGWLLDAVARFEKLQMWVEIGDLQERLGNQEAADIAHRKVVDAHLQKGERVEAARWLEERLRAPEEAVQVLRNGWPDSKQAKGCVQKLFQMFGQCGNHSASRELLGELSEGSNVSRHVSATFVIGILADLTNSYPDEEVRHRAKDSCRRWIARQWLKEAEEPEQSLANLRQLERLEPDDPILRRDIGRFYQKLREGKQKPQRVQPPPLPAGMPELVRHLELPRQIQWVRILSSSRHFFAVGSSPMRLTLVRGLWNGEHQSLSWDCAAAAVKSGLLFELTDPVGGEILIRAMGTGSFQRKYFPANDESFDSGCAAGSPHWLNPHHWPVAVGGETLWTAHLAGGFAILSSHSKKGQLLQTMDVTAALLLGSERLEHTRLCLAVIGDRGVVALGNRVVITRTGGDGFNLDLPGQVTGLIPTLAHTRAGCVALMKTGAAVHWLGTPGWIELDRDLSALAGAFVAGGPLVLVSERKIHLFEVDSQGVGRTRTMDVTGQKLVGVTATGERGHFATLNEMGGIHIYRVPA